MKCAENPAREDAVGGSTRGSVDDTLVEKVGDVANGEERGRGMTLIATVARCAPLPSLWPPASETPSWTRPPTEMGDTDPLGRPTILEQLGA